jgi:uncharacterized SAM-binding protein YcdF (DUF218 family)
MFFVMSKMLEGLTRPADLIVYVLFAGVVLSWISRSRQLGIILTTVAALAFAVIMIPWMGAWINAPLETRFPRPAVLPKKVDGIIVLGGALEPYTTAKRGLPTLTTDAERMTEFVRLAKLYPSARLVFGGGNGLLGADMHYTEANAARLFIKQQGLNVERVIFEGTSRNTYEDIRNSKALVRPRLGQTWLLVQSAVAVPRSVGIFSKAGWPIIPVPVAYKSANDDDINLADDLAMLDRAAHEWLGLIAYRVTGKTDVLFPSPQKP